MKKVFPGLIIIALLILIPFQSVRAGFGSIPQLPVVTDSLTMQLVSYYDLRNRQSLVQVSNISTATVAIHVQIFQNDLEGCPELNFLDTLTPNDTHVYDLDNILGNALPVNIDLGEDSNGFVVITQVESATNGAPAEGFQSASLIGNFRIIDSSGYEYRSNSAGFPPFTEMQEIDQARLQIRYTVNFNQIGGNNLSDIVGIQLLSAGPGPSSVQDYGVGFGAFVYDDAESSTSCDFVNFVCGGFFGGISVITNAADTDVLNYGINDIFPSTNGDNLICQGNQNTSGFLDLIGSQGFAIEQIGGGRPFFVGYAGLNNGNGTGSMDSWVSDSTDICDFFPGGNCPFDFGIGGGG